MFDLDIQPDKSRESSDEEGQRVSKWHKEDVVSVFDLTERDVSEGQRSSGCSVAFAPRISLCSRLNPRFRWVSFVKE